MVQSNYFEALIPEFKLSNVPMLVSTMKKNSEIEFFQDQVRT